MSAPNGGEAVQTATTRPITWSKSANVLAVDVQLTRDGGASWQTLASGVTEDHFDWNVVGAYTNQARVRVRDAVRQNILDESDANFVIFVDPVGVSDGALPAQLALSAPAPNPSRGLTTMELSLPARGEVRIDVYDVAGRRVQVLSSGARGAGVHRIEWDGQDASGSRAGAGVYLVRVRAGAQELTRRVNLALAPAKVNAVLFKEIVVQ